MIIKTITCHNVYNYGASLQAYALQHYLESLGNEVEIIDFQPWFHQDRYNPFYMTKGRKLYDICKACPPLKYVLVPLKEHRRLRDMITTWGRKKAFDKFTSEYLHLTRRYETSDELRNDPPKADVYVAGSDQIWNTESNNGKEPGYYLDFGTAKKISYAASFAISRINEKWKPFVKQQLSHFAHISVREKTGLKILEDLGFKDARQVMDPVFLLDRAEWSSLAKESKDYGLKDKGYILVYDFLYDERIEALTKKIAKQKRLPIVSVNDFKPLPYADKNINDAGPLEFLSLIEHADTVVCSSFHATAFSLIFQKPFYVFPLKNQNNSSRMEDLLSTINLTERFLSKDSINDFDYKEVNSILASEIIISKNILKKYIGN